MSQQFYVIRNNPAPNTEAFRAKEARDAAKRKRKGGPAEEPRRIRAGVRYGDRDRGGRGTPPKPVQRQQPQKKSRSQRKNQPKGGGARPPVKGDQQ